MGAVRDHSILIACIGAGSAVIAAFAKPIVDALTPHTPEPGPKAVIAAPADPTPQTPTPVTPTPGGIVSWSRASPSISWSVTEPPLSSTVTNRIAASP